LAVQDRQLSRSHRPHPLMRRLPLGRTVQTDRMLRHTKHILTALARSQTLTSSSHPSSIRPPLEPPSRAVEGLMRTNALDERRPSVNQRPSAGRPAPRAARAAATMPIYPLPTDRSSLSPSTHVVLSPLVQPQDAENKDLCRPPWTSALQRFELSPATRALETIYPALPSV